MAELLVDIKDVSYSYRPSRPILNNISMVVRKGQIVAIMGGSGSGKTTLLRNLCGQIRPHSGEISVMSNDMMRVNHVGLYNIRRKIGMLFQHGGLFTDMTVFDNVAFPLRAHTNWPFESIADLVQLKLEAVGLRGVANLYPSELSGGMARRVALARAVALDPELVLYDEPFSGLDPISSAITAKLIRDMSDALRAGSVIVTHNIAETFQIADYVYLMWQGSIVAEGTPEQMKVSTLPYVRQFFDVDIDGPLPFHQPAEPLPKALRIQ